MNFPSKILLNVALRATVLSTTQVLAQMPPAIAVREEAVIVAFHAEGAQIYECKPDSGISKSETSTLTWQFREPVATLIIDGKSVGRHYAGPNWVYIDGSEVKGKVVGSAPGATSNDILWLKMDVVEHSKSGILSNAATVERINTKGGMLQGPCEGAGNYRGVPYSADYVFLRKND